MWARYSYAEVYSHKVSINRDIFMGKKFHGAMFSGDRSQVCIRGDTTIQYIYTTYTVLELQKLSLKKLVILE